MIKLGVDVGGIVYADLVVFADESSGKIELTKVASTPRSPDEGVLNGIRKLASQFARSNLGRLIFFYSTVVDDRRNQWQALIERKGWASKSRS